MLGRDHPMSESSACRIGRCAGDTTWVPRTRYRNFPVLGRRPPGGSVGTSRLGLVAVAQMGQNRLGGARTGAGGAKAMAGLPHEAWAAGV